MFSSSHIGPWRDYRKRVIFFFGSWLGGFFILTLLAFALSAAQLGNLINLVMPVLGVIWFTTFILAAIRLQLFRCPSCNQQFFKASWYCNPFARKCVHCALPKWQQ